MIAELAIALHASKLGIRVLRPMAEGARYDLVFDLGATLIRVQCKWAAHHGDVIKVPTRGSYHSPGRGYVRSTYSRADVDGIAAYCQELDRCYWAADRRVLGPVDGQFATDGHAQSTARRR